MNQYLVSFLNSLILISLLLGIPLLAIGITCGFKLVANKKFKMFLYSFASGLVIIMGSVGFIGEAIESLAHHFDSSTISTVGIIGTKIGIIVGGAILGASLVFLIRYLTFKKNKNNSSCKACSKHSHNIYLSNYGDIDCKIENKKSGLILLMSHRLVDGLSLGFLTLNAIGIGNFYSWGMIMIFILHLVPTTIVVFLTQYDIYNSKKKAFLYSLYSLLIISPFVIIGSLLSSLISNIYWLMPLLYSISGTILVIISILELIPEFIHNKQMDTKYWYLVVLTLIAGIVLALLLVCIHT